MVEDHLVLVIVNVLFNAADAMPKGGEIVVRGRRVDRGVELTVTDTGIGMADDVLRNALSPLFTTKERGAGTGLGLFVSNRVLRAVGGTLSLVSREGEGTQVTIFLPTGAE